jgi:HPt (histidine-containing phosphotransfer) domain-containing protein
MNTAPNPSVQPLDLQRPASTLAAARPAPALDPQAIARLRELDPQGRSGVVQRVLAAYEASLLRVLALIQAQAALAAPDPKVLMDNAHMLKSSSTSVGAFDLARLCEAMENRIRATPSAQPHDCERFVHEIERALIALRSTLHA